MTIQEAKKYLKDHRITQEKFAEISGIPFSTIRKIFSGNTPAPRIDTMSAIEEGIDKIKRSTGEYPIDLDEYERITRNNELAYKISQMPEDVQDALFTFIDKIVESPKK